MKKSYSYFIEKSSVLIHSLLIGEGTAKQRLVENELQLSFVLALEVPDDLKKIQMRILKTLSRKPALGIGDKITLTSFRHTLIYMRNSTASKIINDLYTLYVRTKWHQNSD